MTNFKTSYIFLFLLLAYYWLGLFFYDFLDRNFGLGYIDEGFSLLIAVFYLICKRKVGCIGKKTIYFALFIIFYASYSIYIQSNAMKAIFMDIAIVSKSFIVFFCIYDLRIKFARQEKQIIAYNMFVGIILLCLIAMDGFNIIPTVRYGTTFSYTALALLFCYKINLFSVFLISALFLMACIGLKSKTYAFSAIAVGSIFILYNQLKRGRVCLKFKHIVILVFIVSLSLFTIKEKIFRYVTEGSDEENPWARVALHMNSFPVAIDYFPFGAGLASYASWASGVYYSKIYFEYGLSKVHGITEDKHNFIADTFYPQVIGQFGFVGLIIFFLWLLWILKKSYNFQYAYNSQMNSKMFLVLALLVIHILIESFADATMVQNRGVFVCFLMALCLTNQVTNSKRIHKTLKIKGGH